MGVLLRRGLALSAPVRSIARVILKRDQQAAAAAATFELGVNYWPRRRAMYMWGEFDPGEVRGDLARMAGIGFDSVRVFALSCDFLPERGRVDRDLVARLVEVVDAAGEAGLRVVPTLVVINMSGRMWWPDWMLDRAGRPADLFSEPAVLEAQELLVRTCAGALAGHGTLRAFDIANEIDGAQLPRSREAYRCWLERLAGAIREEAPGVPIRIGAHLPSLAEPGHMRIDDVAGIVDEDVIHAYPLYSWAARSYLDPELVPFACALTSALAARGRPALVQELGLCTAPPGGAGYTFTDDFLGSPRAQYLGSEEEGALYYEAVLNRLVETGAAGAYAWCWGDYDSSLFSRPPLDTAIRERTFGLVRADGTEKPAAGVFRELRRRRDAGELSRGPAPPILDAPADDYYHDPGGNFERLYARWLEARA